MLDDIHSESFHFMSKKTASGFTLVELLVVISIIALLVSILMPALSKAREQAKRLICMTNLKSMGSASFMYGQDFNDYSPDPWFFQFANGNQWPTDDRPIHHMDDVMPATQKWAYEISPGMVLEEAHLWPYLEEEEVFLCPSTPRKREIGPAGMGNLPFGYDRVDPPKYWSYVMNGQVADSLGYPHGWHVRFDKIKPNPADVIMIFDEYPLDYHAYDNTVTLVPSVYQEGNDSVTDYHNNAGTILFWDLHVEMMLRLDYLDTLSTPSGTKRLFGGYMGFQW